MQTSRENPQQTQMQKLIGKEKTVEIRKIARTPNQQEKAYREMKITKPHNYFQEEENPIKVPEMKQARDKGEIKKKKIKRAPISML